LPEHSIPTHAREKYNNKNRQPPHPRPPRIEESEYSATPERPSRPTRTEQPRTPTVTRSATHTWALPAQGTAGAGTPKAPTTLGAQCATEQKQPNRRQPMRRGRTGGLARLLNIFLIAGPQAQDAQRLAARRYPHPRSMGAPGLTRRCAAAGQQPAPCRPPAGCLFLLPLGSASRHPPGCARPRLRPLRTTGHQTPVARYPPVCAHSQAQPLPLARPSSGRAARRSAPLWPPGGP